MSVELQGLARILIIVGFLLAVLGLALFFWPKVPWLGKLPGDIAIQRGNFSFYFPITTCIILSIIVSAIIWLFRLFR